MSDYWSKKWDALKEEEKKKKKQETPSGYWEQKSAELKAQTTATANDDIAPVKTTTTEKDDKKKWYDGWFQKGAFEDGYQLGDISKTILGTLKDTETNLMAGVIGMGERVVDAGAYVAGAVGSAFGADKFADKTKDFIAKDLYDEKAVAKKLASANVAGYLASTVSDFDEDSVLDDKADSILQSGGQLAATAGLQFVGVPWFLTTGATSFGGAAEEAFNEDATYAEAGGSALISAGAEILTEKLFGGIKFGGKTLDDVLLQPLVNKISNKVGRTLVNMGIDAVGEGSEEIFSSVFHNLGTALYKEESIDELLTSEEAMDEYIQSFIGGMALGGGVGSFNAANSIKSGRDYKTGLTDNEQKVIDKEIENRIAEQEADGKKLTGKEKAAIEEDVKRDLEKGYISIDTIESAIGGETYDSYKSLTEHETEIKKEIETLENLPDNQISVKQREQLKALREELKALEDDSTVAQYKDRLSQEVSELAKNDRLVESYNEKARRGQAFEADLSKYSEKQRATVQRAIDSGVLNNTNRSHELVDLVAKLEEDKALPFDFTNNEKLKETGFALEGKTVNGYVTKDGVTLNVNSKKALNSVVGHEITHVLEGTELYSELQQVVKNYAVTKGEYETRYEALTKLYAGVDGANIEAEITADLIGDYLFSDTDFVNRLSTEKPNIFQKVYDEIKYLYKIATAGSKEARELERVKRAFDKAYKESGTKVADTKYSLSEYTAEEKQAHNKAVLEHFGRTVKWAETGYLLLDGSKLDLSGKHDGAPGGYRTVDHRDITEALGYDYGGEDYSGSLIQFMSEGNIRIVPEINGINLSVKPTKAQEQALSDYISRNRGEMLLDIDDLNGNTVVSVEYPKGTYYKKILSDIQEWFDNGKKPEVSGLSSFLSLTKDGEAPRRYGNFNIFGEDVALEKPQTDMQDEAAELAPSQAVANNATTTEESSAIRSEMEQVETAEEAPAENIAPQTQKKRKPSKAALVRLTKKQTYSGGRNLQGAYNVDGKQYISDGVFVAEFNAIDERLEHNAEMPIEAFQNFLNNAVNGQSAEKYSIDFDKITEINKGKKDGAFISVGGVPFNSKYVEAVLRAIENPVFALSKHRGGINVLVAVGDNGKVMLMPVRAGEKLTAAYEAQEITAAPESITPTTAEDATAARAEGMANINDADAPQEVEAPYYETENSATPEDPFTDRDYKAVGNRKVKAYMYENPEVRPFFQEAAQAMLGDLQNSTKGERVYNDEAYYESGGTQGWTGVERHTTEDIAYLLDKGYTYAEIEKGIKAIIEDNGAENIAIAKRIEFALNDRLRQGYTDIYGNQIPRNQEYLNMLSQKQAAEIASAQAPMYSDADAPLPTDEDAPVEDIAPSAPVAEKYEAIRPARQKQTEPRMARADTAEPRMARADKPPRDPKKELRSWAETSTESEALDGQIPMEELDQELIHYQPISNRKTLETANARLGNLGYEKSLTYFEGKFAGSDTKVEDIVLGERLVQEAVKRGDKATAMKLIQDIAILGTELGQKVQALSIIQRLTPEGQLMMLQRVVERGKAKGDKAFEGVEVTEEQAGRILDTLNPDGTFDQAELNAAVEDVKQEIADQMKVTAGEKINAYRYLAMLGNAKTHIRNLVSNIAMKGTAAVKNALARTAEDLLLPEAVLSNRRYGEKGRAAKSVIPNGTKVRAADRDNIGTVKSYDAATGKYTVYFENEAGHSATVKLGADVVKPLNPIKSTAADSTADDIAPTRTKTWRRATEEVKAYAKQVTAEMESVLSGENKYSASGDIKAKRRIFKNSAMNSLYEINNKLLTKEDTIFKNPAFESSFREFLTANGIRTDEDIKYNPEIVEKGKQYATEQALIATFQQESWLANKIGEIENKNAAFGVAVGAIMPFKKTPINIAKTGLNYSPLGFAKSLFYDAAQVRKGEMDKSTLIDHLAQNVTGSALAVAGYLLAKSGILTGAGDDDKEGDYDYQLGKQGYSLKIGDQTYSLSWLTPVSMPLFVGANAYEQLVEDKGWSGDVVMETLAQTLDPLSEMSFLSGLDNVLSSYDSGIQKFMGIGESMAQNYATQFVPTALSQVAAITDDKKRTTKVGADSGFRFLDQAVNQIKYKIPGLRQTLEPATDIWGNEVEQSDNLITRAFENAIAPYARKENISTEIDEEIKGLYRETGEDGLIPSIPKNYLNYNNEKYEMSAGEYTAYKKTYGQTASSMLEALFNTSTYRNATVEERADMVDDVYDYARDEANKEYLSGNGIDYTNAEKEGKEYYRENFIKGAIENDVTVEEYGFSYNYPEKYKFLKDIGVSYGEYSASDESKDAYSWAFNNPEKYTLSKAVASDVITYRKYAGELYDIKADKDSSGKSITGSRKEKVIEYINNLDADYGERIILFKSEYNADDTYNYDIIDYLNSREDISYEEMETILKELGFIVSSDGTITWD